MLCGWILYITHKYYQPSSPLLPPPPTTTTPYPEKNLYLILPPPIPRKKTYFSNLICTGQRTAYGLNIFHIYIWEYKRMIKKQVWTIYNFYLHANITCVYIYITWITYKNFMKARSTIFGTICDYDRKYGYINIR